MLEALITEYRIRVAGIMLFCGEAEVDLRTCKYRELHVVGEVEMVASYKRYAETEVAYGAINQISCTIGVFINELLAESVVEDGETGLEVEVFVEGDVVDGSDAESGTVGVV